MRRGSAGATPLTRPVGVARGAPALGIAWLIAAAIALLTGASAVVILLVVGLVAFAAGIPGGWLVLRGHTVQLVTAAELAQVGDDLHWQVHSSGPRRVFAVVRLQGEPVGRGWLEAGSAAAPSVTTLHGTAPDRGVYTSVEVQASSAGRLGLVWWRRKSVLDIQPLSIAPTALEPGVPVARSLGEAPDVAVIGGAPGRDEIDGVRQWREGDELSAVHWPSTLRSGEYVIRQRQRDVDLHWVVQATAGTGNPDHEAARARESIERGLAAGAAVAVRVDDGEPVPIRDREAMLQWTAAFESTTDHRPLAPATLWRQRSISLPTPEPDEQLTPGARWAVAAATVAPLVMMLEPLGYGTGAITIVVGMIAVGAAFTARGPDHRRLGRQAAGLVAAACTAAALIDPSAISSVATSLRFLLPQVLVTLVVLQGFECTDRRSARVSLACAAMLIAYAAGIRVDERLAAWLAGAVLMLAVGAQAVSRVDRRPAAAGPAAAAPADAGPRRRAATGTGIALAASVASVLALLAVVPVPAGPAQLTLPTWLDDYRPTPSDGQLVAADGSPLLGGTPSGSARTGSGSAGYPGFTPTMDTSLRGTLGDEVVLRVRAPYPDFWRGQTFTQFDGRVWRVNSATGRRTEGPDHEVQPAQGDVDTGLGDPFIQTFYAELDLPNIVFAAGRAQRVLLAAPMWARPDGALRAEVVLPAGSAYTVLSQRSGATADGLIAEGDIAALASPAEFVAVPDTTSERTRSLARQLAAGSTYETIIGIQDWLADNVEYDLDAPVPPAGADAVDHFLFGSQRGFCEQIASATAIMLRTLGVPARIATGYVPSERDEVAGVWLSRARDAHAWVEVRFPNFGWVAFDPTASVPLAGEAQRTTIGGDLARAIADAVGDRLPLVLAGAGSTAVLVLSVRATRGWWWRRRRGRWGVLQDRFVTAALRRGAPPTAPNAELARVFDRPAADELAATLDASAFSAGWTDDDTAYAHAVAVLADVERVR